MGGCGSTNQGDLFPLLGSDEFALEILSKIGLTNSEVRKFCLMFDDINADKSGIVTSVDVLSYLNMEPDDLSMKLLSSFDIENIGTLTFCEFTCAIWNFLSLDTRNLPSFLFHLFDNERLFILNNSQIKSALKMIHQKSNDRVVLKKLMDELQDLTPITRPIFRKYCQRNPFLCQPVASLQLLMRKNVFGEIFWAGLCRRRLGDTTLLEADSLFKIRDHLPKRSSLNRNALSPEAQDRLDGVTKARERALDRFQEQRKSLLDAAASPGTTDVGKSTSKLINKGKVVPMNNKKKDLTGDPVELMTTSPFRKIALLDLEDHPLDSDGESPSLTASTVGSRDSPTPIITKVLVNGHRTTLVGYTPTRHSRKSKSVLRRESTYLAADSEESESSGGDDHAERIRSRRKRLKNKHKKAVRFSEVNTYIYPDSSISFSSTGQVGPFPSSISHPPVIESPKSAQMSSSVICS
jgi:Ca2+-binding EF-hand superfamily protein